MQKYTYWMIRHVVLFYFITLSLLMFDPVYHKEYCHGDGLMKNVLSACEDVSCCDLSIRVLFYFGTEIFKL